MRERGVIAADFPTRVGVNRIEAMNENNKIGFPHAGGGEPQMAKMSEGRERISPRGWG